MKAFFEDNDEALDTVTAVSEKHESWISRVLDRPSTAMPVKVKLLRDVVILYSLVAITQEQSLPGVFRQLLEFLVAQGAYAELFDSSRS